MISFFSSSTDQVFLVQSLKEISSHDIEKLQWLFGDAKHLSVDVMDGFYIGPRANMVTPWSTNAVEITQNMGVEGIQRIEKFSMQSEDLSFDYMLFQKYEGLKQDVFTVNIEPASILQIHDISAFNSQEGLALNEEEINYLEELSKRLARPLTDSEVFGFSQVNSEHCRHKIFNGTFVIDGDEKKDSLFQMIKKTSKENPNSIVSAYKDNVAFIDGPTVEQFAPEHADKPSLYKTKKINSVISIKAETHNFPTTVEPFNGAATGSGGEIRDRLAGGQGSIPLSGSAVYMTSYSRMKENRPWEKTMAARPWLYQTPLDILIKASNGASDFGNKFGQPLINGSLLTFEHIEDARKLGFDKVIMLAGGVGYGKKEQAIKQLPQKDNEIIVMGGDNYRIGMGGAAVSSADTGAFGSGIELNAVQRSNPEMQKRVANAIRGLVESEENPIVSIHDHGAGGHLNCLSELVEETGGKINMDKLPIGDTTLSAKEIIGNESQERMGLVIGKEHVDFLKRVASRERAPLYEVGIVTGDNQFSFTSEKTDQKPIDLAINDMLGSPPKTIMKDASVIRNYKDLVYTEDKLSLYLEQVLSLEAVACKDWLTNKVDRCVGGRVAKQQCCGPLQLPLNNCGVMALDFDNNDGVASSVGHAPVSGLIDAGAGARNAIAESLTNIVWAPMNEDLHSVSLSANWMWPCKNEGEDARLYEAVKATSDMALALGINIPTGKDSLSMAQKYKDETILAPGTVIVSAAGHCSDIRNVIEPVFALEGGSIYYLNLSSDQLKLGGSSFAQTQNKIGKETPDILDVAYFRKAFDTIQTAIKNKWVTAGHDISAGGMITALLEMCFSSADIAADLDLQGIESDIVKLFFAENSGLIVQASSEVEQLFTDNNISFQNIGKVVAGASLIITHESGKSQYDIASLRDKWYEPSYLLDIHQTGEALAEKRFSNYKKQPLNYKFPEQFTGEFNIIHKNKKPMAAILREKGSNSEREMANAMYRAGFDVLDVHMTDLIEGREDLSSIQFLGAVGGFSNSDVLGSAKGWAGAIKYNDNAAKVIKDFFAREDTLSVGICNGCQLFLELDLIHPSHEKGARMTYNDSHKHESAFTSVIIDKNNSVMLSGLEGANLGVWISHGEGKFSFPYGRDKYNIVATYGYDDYPSNPNGSDFNTAMISSDDGRHLVTMPHIERSTYPWNWAYYPANRNDKYSPWLEAFLNAKKWCDKI